MLNAAYAGIVKNQVNNGKGGNMGIDKLNLVNISQIWYNFLAIIETTGG